MNVRWMAKSRFARGRSGVQGRIGPVTAGQNDRPPTSFKALRKKTTAKNADIFVRHTEPARGAVRELFTQFPPQLVPHRRLYPFLCQPQIFSLVASAFQAGLVTLSAVHVDWRLVSSGPESWSIRRGRGAGLRASRSNRRVAGRSPRSRPRPAGPPAPSH